MNKIQLNRILEKERQKDLIEIDTDMNEMLDIMQDQKYMLNKNFRLIQELKGKLNTSITSVQKGRNNIRKAYYLREKTNLFKIVGRFFEKLLFNKNILDKSSPITVEEVNEPEYKLDRKLVEKNIREKRIIDCLPQNEDYAVTLMMHEIDKKFRKEIDKLQEQIEQAKREKNKTALGCLRFKKRLNLKLYKSYFTTQKIIVCKSFSNSEKDKSQEGKKYKIVFERSKTFVNGMTKDECSEEHFENYGYKNNFEDTPYLCKFSRVWLLGRVEQVKLASKQVRVGRERSLVNRYKRDLAQVLFYKTDSKYSCGSHEDCMKSYDYIRKNGGFKVHKVSYTEQRKRELLQCIKGEEKRISIKNYKKKKGISKWFIRTFKNKDYRYYRYLQRMKQQIIGHVYNRKLIQGNERIRELRLKLAEEISKLPQNKYDFLDAMNICDLKDKIKWTPIQIAKFLTRDYSVLEKTLGKVEKMLQGAKDFKQKSNEQTANTTTITNDNPKANPLGSLEAIKEVLDNLKKLNKSEEQNSYIKIVEHKHNRKFVDKFIKKIEKGILVLRDKATLNDKLIERCKKSTIKKIFENLAKLGDGENVNLNMIKCQIRDARYYNSHIRRNYKNAMKLKILADICDGKIQTNIQTKKGESLYDNSGLRTKFTKHFTKDEKRELPSIIKKVVKYYLGKSKIDESEKVKTYKQLAQINEDKTSELQEKIKKILNLKSKQLNITEGLGAYIEKMREELIKSGLIGKLKESEKPRQNQNNEPKKCGYIELLTKIFDLWKQHKSTAVLDGVFNNCMQQPLNPAHGVLIGFLYSLRLVSEKLLKNWVNKRCEELSKNSVWTRFDTILLSGKLSGKQIFPQREKLIFSDIWKKFSKYSGNEKMPESLESMLFGILSDLYNKFEKSKNEKKKPEINEYFMCIYQVYKIWVTGTSQEYFINIDKLLLVLDETKKHYKEFDKKISKTIQELKKQAYSHIVDYLQKVGDGIANDDSEAVKTRLCDVLIYLSERNEESKQKMISFFDDEEVDEQVKDNIVKAILNKGLDLYIKEEKYSDLLKLFDILSKLKGKSFFNEDVYKNKAKEVKEQLLSKLRKLIMPKEGYNYKHFRDNKENIKLYYGLLNELDVINGKNQTTTKVLTNYLKNIGLSFGVKCYSDQVKYFECYLDICAISKELNLQLELPFSEEILTLKKDELDDKEFQDKNKISRECLKEKVQQPLLTELKIELIRKFHQPIAKVNEIRNYKDLIGFIGKLNDKNSSFYNNLKDNYECFQQVYEQYNSQNNPEYCGPFGEQSLDEHKQCCKDRFEISTISSIRDYKDLANALKKKLDECKHETEMQDTKLQHMYSWLKFSLRLSDKEKNVDEFNLNRKDNIYLKLRYIKLLSTRERVSKDDLDTILEIADGVGYYLKGKNENLLKQFFNGVININKKYKQNFEYLANCELSKSREFSKELNESLHSMIGILQNYNNPNNFFYNDSDFGKKINEFKEKFGNQQAFVIVFSTDELEKLNDELKVVELPDFKNSKFHKKLKELLDNASPKNLFSGKCKPFDCKFFNEIDEIMQEYKKNYVVEQHVIQELDSFLKEPQKYSCSKIDVNLSHLTKPSDKLIEKIKDVIQEIAQISNYENPQIAPDAYSNIRKLIIQIDKVKLISPGIKEEFDDAFNGIVAKYSEILKTDSVKIIVNKEEYQPLTAKMRFMSDSPKRYQEFMKVKVDNDGTTFKQVIEETLKSVTAKLNENIGMKVRKQLMEKARWCQRALLGCKSEEDRIGQNKEYDKLSNEIKEVFKEHVLKKNVKELDVAKLINNMKKVYFGGESRHLFLLYRCYWSINRQLNTEIVEKKKESIKELGIDPVCKIVEKLKKPESKPISYQHPMYLPKCKDLSNDTERKIRNLRDKIEKFHKSVDVYSCIKNLDSIISSIESLLQDEGLIEVEGNKKLLQKLKLQQESFRIQKNIFEEYVKKQKASLSKLNNVRNQVFCTDDDVEIAERFMDLLLFRECFESKSYFDFMVLSEQETKKAKSLEKDKSKNAMEKFEKIFEKYMSGFREEARSMLCAIRTSTKRSEFYEKIEKRINDLRKNKYTKLQNGKSLFVTLVMDLYAILNEKTETNVSTKGLQVTEQEEHRDNPKFFKPKVEITPIEDPVHEVNNNFNKIKFAGSGAFSVFSQIQNHKRQKKEEKNKIKLKNNKKVIQPKKKRKFNFPNIFELFAKKGKPSSKKNENKVLVKPGFKK
ncbi:MAG: hypothetical protein PVG30_00340 [Gammaproteobacteria bacterium]